MKSKDFLGNFLDDATDFNHKTVKQSYMRAQNASNTTKTLTRLRAIPTAKELIRKNGKLDWSDYQ